MERKGILKALKEMLKQPKYFRVSLNSPTVDDNLKYFDAVLNSINYENIIPNKDNSLEKNLSLLPKKISAIRTIIVYEDGEELKEVLTNITITYKRREKETIETHLGESNALFIDMEEKMNPVTEEELEIYKISMSAIIKTYLKNLMKQAQEDYDKIISGLEEKTKKKRETMRR